MRTAYLVKTLHRSRVPCRIPAESLTVDRVGQICRRPPQPTVSFSGTAMRMTRSSPQRRVPAPGTGHRRGRAARGRRRARAGRPRPRGDLVRGGPAGGAARRGAGRASSASSRSAGSCPPSSLQRLRAPAAIARAAWAARALARATPPPDVVVCDLVPHVIPLLRRLVRAAGRLLLQLPGPAAGAAPPGALRAVPGADRSAGGRRPAGRRPRARQQPLHGLRRPRDVSAAADRWHRGRSSGRRGRRRAAATRAPAGEVLVLSVNRFDPGKNLALAVDALAALRARHGPGRRSPRVRLVLAGHVDTRLAEARALAVELEARAAQLGLDGSRVARALTLGRRAPRAARPRGLRRLHAARRALRPRPAGGDGRRAAR